jgi:putative acetyltransferase
MLMADIEVTLREFIPGDETAFRTLNEEWITGHFALEPKDQAVLDDPQRCILDRGGKIYFAVRRDEIIGCCALLPIGLREYEVAKMAVAPPYRRAGIGRQLLSKIIVEAAGLGANRLYLETNHNLTGAIALYQSLGFRHLPSERIVPSPYARANIYMELFL